MRSSFFLLGILFANSIFVNNIIAEEAQVILRSTVVGNQEQPKVLYIVPWQQAGSPELVYRPVQTLVDGVFEKVDREAFLRELRYREKISSSPALP